VPDLVTIEAHTQAKLPPPEEPSEYYHDLLTLRWIERELKRDMKAAANLLGVEGKDPLAAIETVRSCVTRVTAQQQANQVTDFRGAYDIVIPDYVAKYTVNGAGVNIGWPTFDEMTGGLASGNLVSLVGKIARGKTWAMLYGCHHGWHDQGLSQMFVSMEMPYLEIHERLTALHAQIPVQKLTSGDLSTHYLTNVKFALVEVKGVKAPAGSSPGKAAARRKAVARQLRS
jgi:replicative DNA helicase